MTYIYPGKEIIVDSVIPVDIQMQRCKDNGIEYKFRRYRPDIRIECISLIVEFEGIQHFQNVKKIFEDMERQTYLECLGYKVIRIPFYIQLTKDMIKFYFDVDVTEGSEVKSGFYSMSTDKTKLNPNCPANFSVAGYQRFLNEFQTYPESTKLEIVESLRLQQQYNDGVFVLPNLIAMSQILIQSIPFLDDKSMFHPFTAPMVNYDPDDCYEIRDNGQIIRWT